MVLVRRRVGRLLLVLFTVSLLSFLLLDLLPADLAEQRLGSSATPEALTELRAELGLDDPLPVRYLGWLGDTLTGDFGQSLVTSQPVSKALVQRFGVTLELLVGAQLLALVASVPLGMLVAVRPNGAVDRVVNAIAYACMAIPSFILAVVLVLVFAVQLRWLPATGLPPFSESPMDHIRSLVLPVVSLAMGLLAVYVRLLRAEMVSTLREDYILNAQARGLPQRWILLRHALRPSSFALVTAVGLNTGVLIGGALVIEAIFVLPGMGSLAVSAIQSRDYPVVQAVVVVVASAYVVVNFAVDLIYGVLDPRVRDAATVTA